MSSDGKIDYRGQAMAAMKMAVAANGFERLKWIRVDQAWHDLGRRAEGQMSRPQARALLWVNATEPGCPVAGSAAIYLRVCR